MIRTICSIVAGYLCMAVSVGLVFSVVLIAPDFAFQAGSRDVTIAWIIYTLIASFLAAMLGGWVAARLARTDRAGWLLAGLIVVLGIASAIGNAARQQQARPPYRSSETTLERASQAVQPTAYAFMAPLIGAAGAILGSRIRRAANP